MKPLHSKTCATTLSLVLILAALSPLWIVLRPGETVGDSPVTEDAYYACAVARNVALGKGLTADGRNPTNGFQPLVTLLSVPFFVVSGTDRVEPIRLLLFASWIVYLATACTLGGIACRSLPTADGARTRVVTIVALLYLGSMSVFLNHFNGLETGFLLLMYGLAWRCFLVTDIESTRGLTKLGGVLGLLVLTRIDAVFFVVVLVALLFLLERRRGLGRALGSAATVAAVSFVVSSPWWLYNLWGFGSLMPTSGTAQQRWEFAPSRVVEAWGALVQGLAPWLPLLYVRGINRASALAIEVLVVVGLLTLAFVQRDRLRVDARQAWQSETSRRSVVFGFALALSVVLLALWYVVSSPAIYFYDRYLSPILLVSTVVGGLVLSHLYAKHARLVTATLVCLCVLPMLAHPLRYFGLVFDKSTYLDDQLQLTKRWVPDEAWVAAYQAGTLGYYRDRVINLDGKVNAEALAARQDMGGYVTDLGVDWLCDWNLTKRWWVTDEWELVDKRGAFELLRRRVTVARQPGGHGAPDGGTAATTARGVY